jgi:hypothetical protein
MVAPAVAPSLPPPDSLRHRICDSHRATSGTSTHRAGSAKRQTLRDTLAGQMQYSYFPVGLEQLGATIRYHELVEGWLQIGDVGVTSRYLNHPVLTLGYRLEADGVAVVYDYFNCCEPPCRAHLARGMSARNMVVAASTATHVGFPLAGQPGLDSTPDPAAVTIGRLGYRGSALCGHRLKRGIGPIVRAMAQSLPLTARPRSRSDALRKPPHSVSSS